MIKAAKLIRLCFRRVRSWVSGGVTKVVSSGQKSEQLFGTSIVSIIARLDNGVEAEIPCQSHLCRAHLHGGFERKHLAALRSLLTKGGHVVDVGANIGLITCVFAECVGPLGRVLAIEPLEACSAVLKRNLARNKFESRVVLRSVCAGARMGSVELHVVDGNEEYSSVGEIVHPSVSMTSHPVQCTVETLDEVCRQEGFHPILVKIDTEGYEYQALQGMVGLLAGARPVISIELVPGMLQACGSNLAQVMELLESSKYLLFDLQGKPAVNLKLDADNSHQYLALPVEKTNDVLHALSAGAQRGDV